MTEANGAVPRTRGPVGILVQIVGFGVGVALLIWCISIAFGPDNREQLSRLTNASPGQIGALLGLSLATVVLNGLIFWVTLRPAVRLKATDVLATNALATFLAYLPFKLSVLCRVLIHNRRDGVPLLTIGAWFAAVAAVVLTTVGPLVAASLWRQGIDLWWWIAGGIGAIAVTGAAVVCARLFAGDRGAARIRGLARPVSIGPVRRFLESDAFARLHAGFGMLGHPGATGSALALRLLDLGAQTTRFMIAASVLGIGLGWEQAALVACTYFMIGLLTPFGMLGVREGGTLGIAALAGIGGAGSEDPIALMILFVSAAESIVHLIGAGAAVAWLRADKLLIRRSPTP